MQLPENAPHFFYGIEMKFIPNIRYDNLLKLCYFAKLNESHSKYKLLGDALRKYQAVSLAWGRASNICTELMKQPIDDYLLGEPTGCIEFSNATFELIVYGKSVLDSISQFIRTYFSVARTEPKCDFKWPQFRTDFENLDIDNGLMEELFFWLDRLSTKTESISAARDQWIHSGFITIPLLWPPTELGCFVIPKDLSNIGTEDVQISSADYFSAQEFFDLHRNNLARIINSVLIKMVEIEARGRVYETPAEHLNNPISFHPTRLTIGMNCRGIRLGPFSQHLI